MRLSRLLVVAALVAAAGGVAAARPSQAAQPCASVGPALTALGLSAHPQSSGVVTWSGHIPSWDGLPLDVDVTLPGGGACPAPLVAFAHGWGGSKTDWESPSAASSSPNKAGWNNVSFASRGYAVLNYTARGWHGSCGPDSSADPLKSPLGLPAACTAGGRQYWVHLDDLRYEIRDVQWLIGRIVDAGVADPAHIGVTGGSYGGGVSWLSALANDRIMCGGAGWRATNGPDPCAAKGDGDLVPWRSPAGTPLHVAAAVPEYTWASLALALLPNGRATDGRPGSPPSGDLSKPIGVPIQSYVTGLYADGYTPPAITNGFYQPPTSTDQTANLPLWSALVEGGVNTVSTSLPGISDVTNTAVTQLERFKSPLSPLLTVDAKVPILQVQGNTDPLFPPIHAQLMWQKVKAAAADYPIALVFADVGHSYATNHADVWAVFNAKANAFMDHYVRGDGPVPALDVSAILTRCRPGQEHDPVTTVTGPTLAAMAHDVRTFSSSSGGATSNVPAGTEGLASDPIVNGGVAGQVAPFGSGCRVMSATTDPGVVAWTFPVDRAMTVAGQPLVRMTVQTPAPDAELAARLWDLSPDGKQTLISRGVYRLAGTPTAPSGPVAFQLSANAWRVPAGDKLKLEVTGADAPYFQPDSIPSVTNASAASLEVPIAEGPATQAAAAAPPASVSAGRAAASPTALAATGSNDARDGALGAALLGGAIALRRLRRRLRSTA
ncbi:MAG TPA: CocE/NonD family hydrolase C-terminal non-catalytic domain-containing protein [Acidimicrobiales bacterium]|nr:CocE/NonD family hydrolase C-terminal non-catalytic domain-containing protein [Acidimicrobiales bacterium]